MAVGSEAVVGHCSLFAGGVIVAVTPDNLPERSLADVEQRPTSMVLETDEATKLGRDDDIANHPTVSCDRIGVEDPDARKLGPVRCHKPAPE